MKKELIFHLDKAGKELLQIKRLLQTRETDSEVVSMLENLLFFITEFKWVLEDLEDE